MTALDGLAAQWPQLNELLDQALTVPPAERARWLDALTIEPDSIKQTLRELLAVHASVETGSFLHSLPCVDLPRTVAPGNDAAVGDTVGPYRLLRELGRGGMGTVWLAERADGQLKRTVALKLPRLAWGAALTERLARERDILASLTHPHIARLYDAGVDALGRPWLAMEYIDGQSIDVFCLERQVPLRKRVELLLQVCDAVAHAHARLVVHRDLKPSNILVSADTQVHLLDFGIAKLIEGDERTHETALTQLSGRALTVDYASPEQIRGEPLSTASDVYSLAVVAYELLAGARPYRLKRGSAAELEEAIATADSPRASDTAVDPASKKLLRGDLDAILNKALKKNSGDRYATVEAFAQDLQRHLHGEPVQARPDSRWYRLRKFALRNRVVVGAAAALTVAVLLGAGVALWQAERATQQALLAQQQAELAKKEARRAEAVQGFLLDIFRANSDQQDDPVAARNATARELLDRGAARVDTALRDAPEARIEVLAMLAEMYYQLQLDEQTVAIESKRVDLLKQLYGPGDRRVAEALMSLAAALYSTSQRQRIVPLLEEARGILDALGDTGSRLRGELLIRLAQAHQTTSFEKMRDYADAALQVLRPHAVPTENRLSPAFYWAANARMTLGDLPQAERLSREAIAELGKTKPPSHLALLQTRISLADALAGQQKIDEALQTYRMAIDEGRAALGADDGSLTIAQAKLAALMHVSGQRDAARGLHEQALQAVQRIKGADTLYAPIVRSEYARSMLAEGNLDAALRLIEAVNASNRIHRPGTTVLGTSLRLQASTLTALGRPEPARTLFAEALPLWRNAGGTAMMAWRLNRFHLDEARLDLAMDDPAAALARLQQVALPPYSDQMPLVPEAVERDVLSSQAQLAQQAVVPALQSATRAVEALMTSPVRHHHAALEAQATLQLGRVLLRAGRVDVGCAAIARALAWLESHDAPRSPAAVDARQAARQCSATQSIRNARAGATGRAR